MGLSVVILSRASFTLLLGKLLSRGIPIYEQLFRLDRVLDRPESEAMHFVGVPLNIKEGDGMIVRPVVFVGWLTD